MFFGLGHTFTITIIFLINKFWGISICDILLFWTCTPKAHSIWRRSCDQRNCNYLCSSPMDFVNIWKMISIYEVCTYAPNNTNFTLLYLYPSSSIHSEVNFISHLLQSKTIFRCTTYLLEISRIQPWKSDTAWQFSLTSFLHQQKNVFWPTPDCLVSFRLGFNI